MILIFLVKAVWESRKSLIRLQMAGEWLLVYKYVVTDIRFNENFLPGWSTLCNKRFDWRHSRSKQSNAQHFNYVKHFWMNKLALLDIKKHEIPWKKWEKQKSHHISVHIFCCFFVVARLGKSWTENGEKHIFLCMHQINFYIISWWHRMYFMIFYRYVVFWFDV